MRALFERARVKIMGPQWRQANDVFCSCRNVTVPEGSPVYGYGMVARNYTVIGSSNMEDEME